MAKLCLNMIVRNEADKIERCLKSVVPYLNHWVICDTGSTDGTPELIEKFMKENGVEGHMVYTEFVNFGQARNIALKAAKECPWGEYDHIFLVDADMELVVEDKNWLDQIRKDAPSYDMAQTGGTTTYLNRRIVNRHVTGEYLGVTHEYLDVPAAGLIQRARFVDHADGTNRKNKFVRDIALLQDGLSKDPNNARYWFYLGQSYRDAGQFARAADAYSRRVWLGGWDEEVWNAKYNYALCLRDMKDEGGFIRELLLAYNMRPSRAEPLYDLAKHYRERGVNNVALMFAEAGLKIPHTKDALFVSDYVYKVGFREEFSITAFYDNARKDEGFKMCNRLAIEPDGYDSSRELARANLFYYLPTLEQMLIPVHRRKFNFVPPPGYTAMNPSIARHNDQLFAVVRTVNYTITPEGQYAIVGTDGSINRENPIHTRNFLLRLGKNLETETCGEILPPDDMPAPAFPLVVGFEDMRLFSWKGSLWTSSCVRELNAEGYCEQVLARISEEGHGYRLDHMKRMLREPRVYEKNWMPLVDDDKLEFVYRPNEIVDLHGKTVLTTERLFSADHMSGGSQVIKFRTGWLSLVHEARVSPQNGQRYYQHRFVFFNAEKTLRSISLPFVFHDKQIEFAAGLAWHPDKRQLLVSYGVRDQEAWVAAIDATQIEALLLK